MSVTSAIGTLIQSVIDILTGILHSLFAILSGVWSVILGLLKAGLATVEGLLSVLWSALPLLLVLGFAILIYQIFVVDQGRKTQKVGAGRKKVA